MKKYVSILIVLFLIGALLVFYTIQQSKLLDDKVYLETSESIRNLKLISSDINILLFSNRYKNNDTFDELKERNIDLSEEFDNLRYEALFEEIESSEQLNEVTVNLEEELAIKTENITKFIEYQRLLIKEKADLNAQSLSSTSLLKALSESSFPETMINIHINLNDYLKDATEEKKSVLNTTISRLQTLDSIFNETQKTFITTYIKNLLHVIEHTEKSHMYFSLAINQNTSETLNSLDEAYTEFHNIAIENTNSLRNALVLYGAVLLLFLLLFAYLLRKQYLSLEQQVADRTQEIQSAYTQLKESQEQLIQSEKMASLGEMIAGVAHEINTPLGYVKSNIETLTINTRDMGEVIQRLGAVYDEAILPERNNKTLSTYLTAALKSYRHLLNDGVYDESLQLLDDSHHGLNEISGLVVSLKDFSRLDRKAVDEVNIHHCIENALKIATNPLRENNIVVEKEFSDLPLLVCMPSKLNQVFLNIITNAAQSMKETHGKLTVKTNHEDNNVIVSFSDEGIGMTEDIIQKMFDPFFTTKPIGEGTGLGMSIAYKIIQEHKGRIHVESQPKMGTTIRITLPINSQ